MPDLTPPPSADGVRELPEEIATAIQYFEMAAKEWGDAQGDPPTGHILKACRSALTAAILSRLGEAEAGREEAHELAKRMELREQQMGYRVEAAEAQLEDALTRVERLEKALEEAAEWHDSKADNLRGRPQSIDTRWRTHKHVEEAERIRSALTEAGRLAAG